MDSDSEEDHNIMENFPRFIILETMEVTPLTKLSPFLIQKVISSNVPAKTVKSIRNGTLLIEVENKKHATSLLKMTNFHNVKIRAYPHQKLNSSKRVVRSRELTLCTIEEIKTELKAKE